MRPALLVPLALLAATGAEARFAPRTDADYRLTSTVTDTHQTLQSSFTVVRTIRFTRHASGYLAEVTVRSAVATGAPRSAAAFERAYAAIVGMPLVIEVDRLGAVGTIRDVDAIWSRLNAAMAAAGVDPRSLTLFDAASAERRAAVLASALAGVLAPTDAERLPGTRTTSIAARPLGGAPHTLAARETVTVAPTRVTIDLIASDPDGRDALTRRRIVDRASGLMLERDEASETDPSDPSSRATQNDRLKLQVP